jgi:lipoprotein NlpI
MNLVCRTGKSCLRMTLTVLLLLSAVAGVCHAQSQLAADDEQCEQNLADRPNVALPHCSALVESGQLSQENLALAFILRGTAYRNVGDYDRAIQDFNSAIRINPRIANAFNNRGIAYDYKSEYDRAIQDYEQAIRLQPNYPDAFNNRGLVYQELGKYDQALQDFDQAIHLKPDYAEAIASRAATYTAKGEYDRAIEECTRAIKLEPNYAGNFNDRATAYLGKKDYQRALQDLDHAVQLSPRDPHVLATRGITYFYRGEFKAAENDLTSALRLAPKEPSTTVWLYLTQVRSGENAGDALRKSSPGLKPVWPEPAARYYLGSLGPTDFLALTKSTDANKERRQRCQAYFFLGEAALIHGDQTEARKMFQESVATLVLDSYEHFGAIAELDRLGTQQAKTH